jgi:hypothetical protein
MQLPLKNLPFPAAFIMLAPVLKVPVTSIFPVIINVDEEHVNVPCIIKSAQFILFDIKTFAPFTIVTLSTVEGTTPPTHVPGELQEPPVNVEEISVALIDCANNNKAKIKEVKIFINIILKLLSKNSKHFQ